MLNYILLVQFNNPPLRFPIVKIQFFRKADNRKRQTNGREMYEHTTFSTSDFYFLLVVDNGNTRKISENTEITYS